MRVSVSDVLRWVLFSFAFLVLGSPAQAQSARKAAVLGVQSLDGDDALATQMTRALRRQAKELGEWQLVGTQQSLAQLSLMHGCAIEEGNACLREISKGLRARYVIHGQMVRSGEKYRVDLHLHDSRKGRRLKSVFEIFSGEGSALEDLSVRLLSGLAGKKSVLEVIASSSEVIVEVAGREETVEGGRGKIRNLNPGRYQVVIRAGGKKRTRWIDLKPDQTTRMEVSFGRVGDVEQGDDVGDEKTEAFPLQATIGGTLAVGGLVAIAFGFRSISILNDYSDEREQIAANPSLSNTTAFQRLLLDAGRNVPGSDACGGEGFYAESGSVEEQARRDACDEISQHETLQWVLLGGGAIFVGVGAYLFFDAFLGGQDDNGEAQALRLAPTFSHDGLGMVLQGDF